MLNLIKNFKGVFGQSAMLKGERKIPSQCSYYRGPEGLNSGGTEYCNLEDQEECMGEINSCQNPQALKKYLLTQGFGWKKIKGGGKCKRALQVLGRMASVCWK